MMEPCERKDGFSFYREKGAGGNYEGGKLVLNWGFKFSVNKTNSWFLLGNRN